MKWSQEQVAECFRSHNCLRQTHSLSSFARSLLLSVPFNLAEGLLLRTALCGVIRGQSPQIDTVSRDVINCWSNCLFVAVEFVAVDLVAIGNISRSPSRMLERIPIFKIDIYVRDSVSSSRKSQKTTRLSAPKREL